MSLNFSRKYIRRRHLHLHLLDKCNLRCKHCYLGGKSSEEVLGFKDAVKVLKYAFSEHIRDITLTGGEPFLYKGLKKLIFEARKLGFEEIRIQSNGTVDDFDKQILNTIDYLCLSLDGPDSTSNDSIRGKNTFKKVIKLIKETADYKCHLKINYVVNNLNKDYILDMIKFVSKFNHIDELHFQTVTPLGSAKENSSLLLKPEDWVRIKTIFESVKKLKIRKNLSVCYQERFLKKFDVTKLEGYSCSFKEKIGCWFLPDGRVYHCCYLLETQFYKDKFNFLTSRIEKNNFSYKELRKYLGQLCDFGINNNLEKDIISICPLWKKYANVAPY